MDDPDNCNRLLIVTKEDIKKSREFFDINDQNKITESLNAVKEWYEKQDHLIEGCKHLDAKSLERLFLLAQGSVEGTKNKIEKLFTSRGMMPELVLNRNIEEFEEFGEIVNFVPLPKLCPSDQSRVMVTQFTTDKLDNLNILSYFRYCFMLGEYRLKYDYCVSERYVIDLKNTHLGVLSKLNPVVIKKAETLCTEGYGTKIKGIHILNAPSFIDRLVFLLKQALREKVASRLHVHSSYEDLHKHIPKDIIPIDYGGEEQSCSKLAAQWKDHLKTEKARNVMKELDNLISDESRRQASKFNEEYMGMPGSFRKLNVD